MELNTELRNEQPSPTVPGHYNLREVAKLTNLPPAWVRALVHAALVGQPAAAKPTTFAFADLLVLRTASRLRHAGFPLRRVRSALLALRQQIAAEKPLSGASLRDEAGRLVAQADSTRWEPETGQCLLHFASQAMPAPPTTLRPSATPTTSTARRSAQAQADKLFTQALAQETAAPKQAYKLYLEALACDPEHIETMINLGRLCCSHNELQRAAAYFRQALRLDAAHAVAHFNLGVTLHDLSQRPAACAAYRAALLLQPHFAIAHYNLATLLLEMNDLEGAQQHFHAYQRLRRRSRKHPE